MKKFALAACAVLCGVTFSFGADGAAVYKKCMACHGAKADTSYLNKVRPLNSIAAAERVELMKAYKAGEVEGGKGKYGMGAVMKGQMASLSEEDMTAVSEYIDTLK